MIEIGDDGMIVPHPLFTDASGNCTKDVTLTMMTHGDYLDANVDERYGLGQLFQRWDEGQPCVTLEWVPVPPGDAPGFAESQFIAGTSTDIVNTWSTDTWFDNGWVIQWDEYLEQKNPYSTNDTWYEDFPAADLIQTPYAADGHYYNIRVAIRTGATGLDGIFYNADLLREAGVDVDTEIPPKTMTALFDIMQRVQDNTDKIPYWLAFAGDTRWEWDWYRRFLLDQLMPDVAAEINQAVDDNDDAYGTISQMEGIGGVLSGAFDNHDPRVGEFYRIMKEWSQYFQPGYASPSELVAEIPAEFLRGNVAMTTAARWRVTTIEQYPGLDFEWGSFFLPPIDTEFSEFATGEPIRRHGGAGALASTAIVPYFVASHVAEDPDKLAAAVDLAQYATAPASLDFYCGQLVIPCFATGTPVEEVFTGDPARQRQMRAFFDPAPVDIPLLTMGNLTAWAMQGGADEAARLMVEYFQDNLTLEQLQDALQEGHIAGATDLCASKLDEQVAGWEWCSEYVD